MVSSFARVATSKDDVEMPGSIDRLSVEVLCNEGRLVTLKAGIEGEGTQLQGCEVQFENGCSGVVLYQRTPLLFALADQHSQSTADTATKLSFGSNANINVKSNITMAVGNELVGRVVNFKGVPLDGKELTAQATRAIFSPPTLQSDLATISKPLHTGFTAIDALTPIGRGQNMLLIGNEILGRLEIVIDTIVTSGREGVKCVYVSTDGKHNDVVQRLQALGAMKHTTVVAADSINPDCSGLGECVMAAAAGCSIAEHWRKEGQDTLVIVNNIEAHRCFWDFTDRVLIQVTPKIDHRQGRSIGASQGAQRR
jgi:F-type H+-transporting ATPase subunit alpha